MMKEIIALVVWGDSEGHWLKGYIKDFSGVMEISYIFMGIWVVWV